jgi:hypothetical protein
VRVAEKSGNDFPREPTIWPAGFLRLEQIAGLGVAGLFFGLVRLATLHHAVDPGCLHPVLANLVQRDDVVPG